MTSSRTPHVLAVASAATAAVVTVGGLAGTALAAAHQSHHAAGHVTHLTHASAARPAAVRIVGAAGTAHVARPAARLSHASPAARARVLLAGSYQRHDGRLSVETFGVASARLISIKGQPMVGQLLRAQLHRAPGTTYRFQWYVARHVARGATGTTYKPTAADLGKPVAVAVTSIRHGHRSTLISRPTRKVAPPLLRLRVAPSVHGTPKVGRTLVATPGTWNAQHTTFTYRWYAGRAAVAHATAPKLVLTKALVGRTITVQVTAHHAGYSATQVLARVAGAVRR